MEYRFAHQFDHMQASAIREILKFTSDPEVISFAAGNPASEGIPVDTIRQISAKLLQEDPIACLQYSVSEGYTPLRQSIREKMLSREEIVHDFDDLIIMSGAQQGNMLASKVLCNPGDTLVVESPSFIGSLNAFKANGVNLTGIPLEEDGMDLNALEDLLKTTPNVKLIYVIPNFQNPTGLTMSLEKRKGLYELACKYDTMILEDNPYGDLRFAGENVPSIKSMDTEGRVIYSGTFSKVLSPGMRVGFLVAPKPVISKIVICKQVDDVHTNILAQRICHEFLMNTDYLTHIQKLAEICRHKCSLMLEEMDKHLDPAITWTKPEGGLFIWATLPDGVDMADYCTRAVREYKVAVVPGTAFLTDESQTTQAFRLNYSTPSDQDIVKGIQLLGKLKL